MVVNSNVRQFTMVWMRRLAYSIIGVTSVTGTFAMLLGVLLIVSGVLEW
ncbi:MAG: hypothetical protein IMF08_12120 [Proteobacteria bacterium]|nr:hypothetical protein [Pseudomonadota bacterium]MCK4867315.1 hypothetical protein [Alphaproteobacteria bacterium]